MGNFVRAAFMVVCESGAANEKEETLNGMVWTFPTFALSILVHRRLMMC